MVTIANASLISNKSTSLACQLSRSSKVLMASIGARVNSDGCRECVVWPRILAIGFKPFSATAVSLASTNAEAPSEIELELAAVTVPSALNAGFSWGILSILAFPGCSSVSMMVSPLRCLTVTGAISAVSAPDSIAAMARRNEPIAYSSMDSRVSWC